MITENYKLCQHQIFFGGGGGCNEFERGQEVYCVCGCVLKPGAAARPLHSISGGFAEIVCGFRVLTILDGCNSVMWVEDK